MAYDLRLLVERVEACLSAAPRKPLCGVARELGVDRHTVERAVKQSKGKTFRQLQLELLVANALKLLTSEPPRSVKEVSFLLGYRSPSDFSRALRHGCGYSPTEIRKGSGQRREIGAGGNLPGFVGSPAAQVLVPPLPACRGNPPEMPNNAPTCKPNPVDRQNGPRYRGGSKWLGSPAPSLPSGPGH